MDSDYYEYKIKENRHGEGYIIERVLWKVENGIRSRAGFRVCGPEGGFDTRKEAVEWKEERGWDGRVYK